MPGFRARTGILRFPPSARPIGNMACLVNPPVTSLLSPLSARGGFCGRGPNSTKTRLCVLSYIVIGLVKAALAAAASSTIYWNDSSIVYEDRSNWGASQVTRRVWPRSNLMPRKDNVGLLYSPQNVILTSFSPVSRTPLNPVSSACYSIAEGKLNVI